MSESEYTEFKMWLTDSERDAMLKKMAGFRKRLEASRYNRSTANIMIRIIIKDTTNI